MIFKKSMRFHIRVERTVHNVIDKNQEKKRVTPGERRYRRQAPFDMVKGYSEPETTESEHLL